jgi:hypothetical protein
MLWVDKHHAYDDLKPLKINHGRRKRNTQAEDDRNDVLGTHRPSCPEHIKRSPERIRKS